MEKLIESKTAVTPKRAATAEGSEGGDHSVGEQQGEEAPSEEGEKMVEEDYEDLERTHSELLREGNLIDAFMQDNPSQVRAPVTCS